MKKRGFMNLSFGMIFSVILIVIFLAFGIYAIIWFLGFQCEVEIGIFMDHVAEDVNKIWSGSQGSVEKEYSLCGKVKQVCFVDFEAQNTLADRELYDVMEIFYSNGENLFFYPPGAADGLESIKIEHLDIDKITAGDNPYCINNDEGKIKLRLRMDFGETKVRIS